jgi:hypothetical protein
MNASWARTNGLRLVFNLNFDRVFYTLTLAVALGFGAWFGSVVFSG